MPSTFPSVLTSYTNPGSTDKLNSPSHSGIETNQNSGISQLEKVIGVEGTSSVVGTLEYFIKSPASSGGGHVQGAAFGGTGQTAFTKGDLLVATQASVLSKLAVGGDGLFLGTDSNQSSGLKWTSPIPVKMLWANDFGSSNRFAIAAAGGATVSIGTQGLTLDTTTTANRALRTAFQLNSNAVGIFGGDPVFTTNFSLVVAGAANGLIGCAVLGLPTVDASGYAATEDHIGFKLVRESGTYNLYATQASSSTESKTLLTTMVATDSVDLVVVVTSGTSASYYYRKNNVGAFSSATIISSNLPAASSATNHICFGVSNIANAFELYLIFGSFSYQR